MHYMCADRGIVFFNKVPFVQYYNTGRAPFVGQTGYFCILLSDTLLRVYHNKGYVTPVKRLYRFYNAVSLQLQADLAFFPYSGGVYQEIFPVIQIKGGVHRIPRSSRCGIDYRTLIAEDLVYQ